MKRDRAPKTVGDLRKMLEALPDDTPILRGRGNGTFEPFNKWAGVNFHAVRKLNGWSNVSVSVERHPDMFKDLRTKIRGALTFG